MAAPNRSVMRLGSLAIMLSLLLLSACHSALGDAMDSYADARYPAAAAQFRALEPAARHFDAHQFAAYALHRGLTHLALGDARAASRWLGHAKAACDADPDIFDDQDRGALVAAWRSMGHMPGEPGFNETGTASLSRQGKTPVPQAWSVAKLR